MIRESHQGDQIVLASASPRRIELLESAGIRFRTVPGEVDERQLPGETPGEHVSRLAREKARSVAEKTEGRFFIGADTIVLCGEEIMGKPQDADDAARMLRKLSGTSHEVITGFSVYDKVKSFSEDAAVTTTVWFKSLNDEEIGDYIMSGCPFDKAGAYAIQGGAAYMVRNIEGSYTNVVGLPLCEVVEILGKMGAFVRVSG